MFRLGLGASPLGWSQVTTRRAIGVVNRLPNWGFRSFLYTICSWSAKHAFSQGVRMDDSMGRLVYLPAGVSGPDPHAFLEDVLTGWRRAQLAQGTSSDTIRRRAAQVLRMTDFVGTFPWQWTPADADDFFGHLRGVLNRAQSTVRPIRPM